MSRATELRETWERLDRWKQNPPYRVTWDAGRQSLPFRDEESAVGWAEVLRSVRDVRDATLDAQDGPEFLKCECGCGRLFKDGTGCRVGGTLFHEFCYDRHPVVYVERALEMAGRVEES